MPEPVAARVPHHVQLDQASRDAPAAVEQARRTVFARAARMRSTTASSALRRDAEDEAARGTRPAGERPEEERSWRDRPYGTQIDEQLATTTRTCHAEAHQQDALAAKTREDYEELRARLAAWRTLKDSPYAQTIGATGPAPSLDELPKTLAAVRETVSQHAQRMDTRDQTTLGRLSGTIRSAAAETADWRGHAALAVTEQQRRRLLAETRPDAHRAETLAHRVAAAAQQRQQAAVQARHEAPAAVPPVQQRGPRASR